MIKTITIFYLFITILLSIGLPISIGIIFKKKLNFSLKTIFVGALIFLIFQIFTRIPILNFIQKTSWYSLYSLSYPTLTIFMISLSAGIFEEIGRFIGFKFFLKKDLNWENGIGYGIGHGGIESILIVGVNYLAYFIISILNNSGKLNSLTQQIILEPLIKTPSYQFLFAGIERVFAFSIQIALSLIVLYGIKSKNLFYLLIAIIFHTIIDFVAVYLYTIYKNIFLTETLVAIFSILSLVYIIKSKKYFKNELLKAI